MTFRIGQKVACVDDSQSRADGVRELTFGQVYTVRWVGSVGFCGQRYYGVRLLEVMRDEPETGPLINNVDQPFDADRFRPIVERETDISAFHEILRTASQKVDA